MNYWRWRKSFALQIYRVVPHDFRMVIFVSLLVASTQIIYQPGNIQRVLSLIGKSVEVSPKTVVASD